MSIKEITELWYETTYGHHLKCRDAQIHFSEVMNKLYKKLQKNKPEQQCFGDEVI